MRGPKMAERTCIIDGCEKPTGVPSTAHELCRAHYFRLRTYRDPLGGPVPRPSSLDRFWAKVDKNGPVPEYRPDLGPCWLWTASTRPSGHGIWNDDPSHCAY